MKNSISRRHSFLQRDDRSQMSYLITTFRKKQKHRHRDLKASRSDVDSLACFTCFTCFTCFILWYAHRRMYLSSRLSRFLNLQDQMQRIQMTLFTMVPRLLVLSGCIFLHQMAWEVTWGSSAQAVAIWSLWASTDSTDHQLQQMKGEARQPGLMNASLQNCQQQSMSIHERPTQQDQYN